MADDREPYGELAHGIYKDWHAEQPGPKVVYWPWAKADPAWRELMMRIGAAVAAQAVADAKLHSERMERLVFALGAHRPAVFDALRFTADHPDAGPRRKEFLAALKALGGDEEGGDRV
jgi:hypothetical protein